MNKSYLILHWILTLAISPFTSQALDYFFGSNPHRIVGLLEVYPITFLFSIAFSLPTILIYHVLYKFLSNKKIDFRYSKLLLISISVLGITITQLVIEGSMSQEIIIAYSFTTIIVGLFLRLKAFETAKIVSTTS